MSRTVKASLLLITSFILGLLIWLYGYPIQQYSGVFWLVALLMGIPVLVFSQSIGNLGLGNRFVARWPKGFRIMFGVFWVLLCCAIMLLIGGFLSSMIVSQPT